jgi:hypothetical protein
MTNVRRVVLPLGVISVMTLALLFDNGRRVQGAAPPGAAPVLVTNTTADPVPTLAQGTTAVAGTVAATQTGAWNVGLSGTSDVRVVEEPFSSSCLGFQPSDDCGKSCTFTVPQDKRLVIQSITGDANMSAGKTLLVRVSGTPASGQASPSNSSGFSLVVPVSFQQSNGVFDFYGFNQTTLLQVDPGGVIVTTMVKPCFTTGSQASVNLSGHLVPVQ